MTNNKNQNHSPLQFGSCMSQYVSQQGNFPQCCYTNQLGGIFGVGKATMKYRRRFESNRAEVIQVGTTQWRRSASVSRSWVCDGFKGGAPWLP